MDMVVAFIIATLYGIAIAATAILLVYLIFKRVKDKRKENFEKRDN